MRRVLVLLCAFPTPAAADQLLDRLAEVPVAKPLPCDHRVVVENTHNEETERLVYAYDAANGTSELIEGPPEAFEREAERAAKREAGRAEDADAKADRADAGEGNQASFGPMAYADILRGGLAFERVGTSDGLVVYRAAPLPPGTFVASGRDMSKRSEARLWVEPGNADGFPRVRRHAYGLQGEFRVPMIARVRRLSQETLYDEIGGAMRPVRFVITFDADVMGKSQTGETVVTRSDWTCEAGP